MKVLHILHELKFSGAEIMYVDSAHFFQEKGCQLSVMATSENEGDYAPHFTSAGYEVVHNPYPVGEHIVKQINYCWRFVRFLQIKGIDIVHIHVNKHMWTFALCAWIAGKKSAYTFHTVFSSRKHSYLFHVLQRWSAKHIFGCKFQTISDSVFEREIKYYHNKTEKIYNWYGTNRFFPADSEEKKKMREVLQIDQQALVLISIGGCSLIKRHADIIKALPAIQSHHPSVLYLHLGKGETEQEEKELVTELGLDNSVRFLNNQTDVRKYLVASDIYLMTSKHEGISITTIEAMACGIPAILYDVPGLRDFNKSGENSLLISEDYHLLAKRVCYLAIHPEKAQQLADSAREFVNKTFSLHKNAAEIYQLYLN